MMYSGEYKSGSAFDGPDTVSTGQNIGDGNTVGDDR